MPKPTELQLNGIFNTWIRIFAYDYYHKRVYARGRVCLCACVHLACVCEGNYLPSGTGVFVLTRARGGKSAHSTAFRLSSSRHSSLTLHGPCWPRLLLHPHHRAAAAHSCARGGRPKATPLPGDAEDVPKARAVLPLAPFPKGMASGLELLPGDAFSSGPERRQVQGVPHEARPTRQHQRRNRL